MRTPLSGTTRCLDCGTSGLGQADNGRSNHVVRKLPKSCSHASREATAANAEHLPTGFSLREPRISQNRRTQGRCRRLLGQVGPNFDHPWPTPIHVGQVWVSQLWPNHGRIGDGKAEGCLRQSKRVWSCRAGLGPSCHDSACWCAAWHRRLCRTSIRMFHVLAMACSHGFRQPTVLLLLSTISGKSPMEWTERHDRQKFRANSDKTPALRGPTRPKPWINCMCWPLADSDGPARRVAWGH